MVNVKIGGIERSLEEFDESWANEQIRRRRQAGEPVCVQVRIDTPSLNMVLTTPDCGGSGGGGRLPNEDERKVFDLWEKHRLKMASFTVGDLIAFLKQLRRLL